MDAGTLSVRKIFGQDRRHVVPLFQRPYIWERAKQWEPFWEDVRALAERLSAGTDPRPHFLGAIVLDQMNQPTGKIETRLVIDGQQRLTTLQIFLEAFCDLCGQRQHPKYYKALLKLTRNDDPMSEDPDEEFKVWPTNVDQEHFRRVMRCESPEDLRAEYKVKTDAAIGNPIANGYLFFYKTISEWIDAGPENIDTRLDALFNVARDYIRLVIIDLDKEDDAQVIFETLNARGTPLLPMDLVKNYLFHRARHAGDNLNSLYDAYWRSFDENPQYWRHKIGRGHAQRPRIDSYLQHYLTLQTRDEVPVAHLYVVFRQFADGDGSPRETMETLKRYANVYRSFDSWKAGTRQHLFFERLRAMEITTAHPFLMQLFTAFDNNEPVLEDVLSDLESFLVRRIVCNLSTRGYGRLFIDMLKEFSSDGDATVTAVRKFLCSSDAESNRWPSDDEFKQAWLETPLYRTLVRARVRMLLEALERALRTDKAEKMRLEEKLTIEHLLPQQWQTNWPISADGDLELAGQERDRLLHTIGNLTLLNEKLNPAVSNSAWERKRPEILKHSLLRLNHELSKYSAWDEDGIRSRGRQLFELVVRIWPQRDEKR